LWNLAKNWAALWLLGAALTSTVSPACVSGSGNNVLGVATIDVVGVEMAAVATVARSDVAHSSSILHVITRLAYSAHTVELKLPMAGAGLEANFQIGLKPVCFCLCL
jgi:hypothetical protein